MLQHICMIRITYAILLSISTLDTSTCRHLWCNVQYALRAVVRGATRRYSLPLVAHYILISIPKTTCCKRARQIFIHISRDTARRYQPSWKEKRKKYIHESLNDFVNASCIHCAFCVNRRCAGILTTRRQTFDSWALWPVARWFFSSFPFIEGKKLCR